MRRRPAPPALIVSLIVGLARVAAANTAPTVHVAQPLSFTLTQGNFSTQVQAVERAEDAATFYDYSSASSHTGFERAYESKVFLYRDTTTGLVSLFFTHGIDSNVSGIFTGPGAVMFDLDGVPPGAFVAQSDDPFQHGRAELDLGLEPEGDWQYQNNTDGGVIGGLPTDSPWCITITPLLFSNIDSWVYHFASGASIPLDLTEPVTICFAAATGDLDTDEANEISLAGSFDDPDIADAHVATWDFGDGTGAAATFSPGPGSTHHELDPVFHTYGDDATYVPTLTVTDGAGGAGAATVNVNVRNVSPSPSVSGPASLSIGFTETFNGTATDPGSDDLTLTWDFGDGSPTVTHVFYNDGASPDPFPSPAGVFPFTVTDEAAHVYCEPGDYTVTLTATDDDGGSRSASEDEVVAEQPVGPECNHAPECSAGGPYASQCTEAALDAATAIDPDADALTFSWTSSSPLVVVEPAGGMVPAGAGPRALPTATARLVGAAPCGVAADLTLVVDDGRGGSSSCGTSVTFRDTTPPTVQGGGGNLACTWPPNHRFVGFDSAAFQPVLADNCGLPMTWRLVGCASDQPENDVGDGNTGPDCLVSSDGRTIEVRSERQGTEPAGRHYGVAVTATDACGNTSDAVVIGYVYVPHDQSPHETCVRP